MIYLTGSIPVTVCVNTETGEVERVVASDDLFEWEGTGYNEDDRHLEPDEVYKWKQQTEGQMWPAWTWGW